ncbi:uncharacterized protein [Euwallacea similis]|uniref:uncharacterized protein n=1 Tax=Euwallacea similis TaxID=1736056 RepID=UPI003450ECBF
MNYQAVIMNHAPVYWDQNERNEVVLSPSCEEFKQIAFEVQKALGSTKNIQSISRVQNVHDLGQCLIREQLLLCANPEKTYYRVRRFIKVPVAFLDNALENNLDHRRCGLPELVFSAHIPNISSDEVLLAVQTITRNHNNTQIHPSNNLEYFIDYVIRFDTCM